MTNRPDDPDDLIQTKPGFLIVGLGASAGGIEALCEFFTQVPANSGIAYVVILHLSPEHESQLANVLQTVTPLPVMEVIETVRVEPNHVYVVSPNQHLTMVDGELTVSPNTLLEERRAPVDIFFRTLAETHHNRAVCVVLSGTGADGSMGLKRVKERGGVVFVQNPREALFNEMPRSAIATDLIDDVLPVAEIPAKIMAYQASLGTIAIPVEAEMRPEEQQQALREVFTQLRVRTGHDFSNYKRPTLLRRITRRINVRGLPDLPAYAAFVRENPDEVQALLKDLLISVTNFFRDKEAFAVLEQEIIPRIFAGKRPDEQVRIWVVGCASGEEAYSIAMLCAERVLGALDAPSVQIFASDIDEAAIAHAREGVYTLNDTADVSPERLRQFFTPEDQRYRIRREIREMVLFAHHNVLRDPPFSHLDLVSCRNMLIYLNHSAQERVMETLHFALGPGGYLFLGTSESVDGSNDLFATVSREQHIFQSRATGTRLLPVPDSVPTVRVTLARLASPAPEPEERARERISYGDLHQRLLEEYAPPSLVVNDAFDIVHLSERVGRYLQFVGGETSTNLLKVIRPELRLELRTALYQAVQRQTNVQTANLPVRIDDRTETVTIRVRPVLRHDEPTHGFLLIVFEPGATPANDAEPVVQADEPAARQLEDEVQRLKQQLRTSSEQYEYQAEELKATNEELQALNEELRSSNEELETSKEELQSLNEELHTVNQELKVKVEEATQHSTNVQNLVNSTDIGTIFLDRGLRVKLFTSAARELFSLLPADYGRPLSDITHRLIDVDVLADAETVLSKLRTVEREVRTTTGRVYLLRVLPYRAGEDRIGGVVLTFFDITARVGAEAALRESEAKYRTLFETLDEGFAIYELKRDEDGNVVDMVYRQTNQSYERLTGLTNVAGRWASELIPNLEPSWFERNQRVADTGIAERAEDYISDLDRWYSVHHSRVGGDGSNVIIAVFDDISARKRAEERQAFLLQLSDALRAEPDARSIKEQTVRMLGEHLQADRCYISEVFEQQGFSTVGPEHLRPGIPPMSGTFRLADYPETMRELTAQPLVIHDAEADPRFSDAQKAMLAKVPQRALLVAPLRKGPHEVIWALAAAMTTPRQWTDGERLLLEEVAERTWAAVERAHAEAALRESEEKYRALFNSMDEAYAVVEVLADENGQWNDFLFLDANPAFIEHTAMPYPVGKTATQLLGTPNPRWAQVYGEVAETGEPVRVEEEEPLLARIFDLNIFRLGGPGSRRVAVLFTNITARKQAEAERERLLREAEAARADADLERRRLIAVLEQLPVGVHIAEAPSGRLVFDNAAVRDICGDAPFSNNVDDYSRDYAGYYPVGHSRAGEPLASHEWPLARALATGASVAEELVEIRRADGTSRLASISAVAVRDADERVVGAVAASVDVTERKQREASQELLVGISEDLSRLSNEEEIIRTVGAQLAAHLQLTCYHYVDVDEDRGEVTLRHFWHALQVPSILGTYPIAGFIPPYGLDILRSGESAVINNVQNDFPDDSAATAGLKAGAAAQKIGAYVAVPYSQDRRWKAYFAIADSSPRQWTRLEVELIREVSSRMFPRIERVRAEAALRESEERFRTLADAVPQLIWTNDAAGRATYFNQRWFSYSGLTYDQSVGPGWQAIVHGDDAPASVERWQQALAQGEVFESEYRLRRADGVYCWHLGRNVPLRDEHGQIMGWFGSATDIEELKQAEAAVRESEERFRLLVEGARDYAMFLLDPDNRITFWSSGAERVFGWTEAEAIGQSGAIIFTPEDRERGAVKHELHIALMEGRAEDRRWHIRKDGSRLFLDGVQIRLDNETDKLRGFVKVGRDVTALRDAEEALQRAHDELEIRVEERTFELAAANHLLQQEIAERRQLAAQRAVLVERILTEQEAERQRIARELHDTLGQFLSALTMRLSMAQSREGVPSQVSEELARLLTLSSQIDREVDRLTMELRPPALQDWGLADALLSYAEEWSATSRVPVDVLVTGLDSSRLGPAIETTAYRIVQEALTNVLKHAQASVVSVVVERRPGALRVIIEDNGVGFDASAGITPGTGGRQVGLIGMSERAALVGGKLTIETAPGAGYDDLPPHTPWRGHDRRHRKRA